MPKVPIETPQASLNVPGLNAPPTREFGKIGQSLENVGNTVEQTSLKIGDQINHAQAIDASSSAYFSDKLDSQEKMRQLTLQSPDGFIHDDPANPTPANITVNPDKSQRTIADEYKSWANDRFVANQGQMPSLLAQQMYKEKSMNLFSDQSALAQNDVQAMRVKYFDKSNDATVQALGDAYSAAPMTSKLYSDANDMAQKVQEQVGILHNQTDGDAKILANNKHLSRDLVKAAEDDVMSHKRMGDASYLPTTQQWIANMMGGKGYQAGVNPDGTPIMIPPDADTQRREKMGLPTIGTMMDPIQKDLDIKKLQAFLPVARDKDLSSLTGSASAMKSAYDNGGKIRDSDYMGMQSMIASRVKDPLASDTQKSEALMLSASLAASRTINQTNTTTFQALPRAQQMAVMKSASVQAYSHISDLAKQSGLQFSDAFAQATKAQLEQQFGKVINDNDQKKLSDFATVSNDLSSTRAFALPYNNPNKLADPQNSAVMYDSIKSTVQNARSMVPDGQPITYVPTPAAKAMSTALTDNSQSSAAQAAHLQGIQAGSKDYFPQVINQMIKGGLPAGFQIAAINPTAAATQDIVENINHKNDIEKNYEGYAAANPGAATKIKVPAPDEDKFMKGLVQANANGGTYKDTAAIQQVIETQAQKLLYKNQATDPADARAKAYDQLIGSQVHVNEVSGDSNRTSLLVIPKTVGGQMINDVDAKNIQDHAMYILQQDNLAKLVQAPKQANGQPSAFAAQFPEMVAKTGQASFVSTPKPGLTYSYTGPDGRDKQVMGTDGKPLFSPLSEATQPLPSGAKSSMIPKFQPNFGPNYGGK